MWWWMDGWMAYCFLWEGRCIFGHPALRGVGRGKERLTLLVGPSQCLAMMLTCIVHAVREGLVVLVCLACGLFDGVK